MGKSGVQSGATLEHVGTEHRATCRFRTWLQLMCCTLVSKWGSEGYGVDQRCRVAEVKGVMELLGSTELGGVAELGGDPELGWRSRVEVRDCRGLSNPHGSGTRVGTGTGTGMDSPTRHV